MDRHLDHLVAGAKKRRRQPPRLVAQDPAVRPAQISGRQHRGKHHLQGVQLPLAHNSKRPLTWPYECQVGAFWW